MSDSDGGSPWEGEELEAVVDRIAASEDRDREDVLYRMVSAYWVLDELEDVMEPPRTGHGPFGDRADGAASGTTRESETARESGVKRESETTPDGEAGAGAPGGTDDTPADASVDEQPAPGRLVGAVREVVTELLGGPAARRPRREARAAGDGGDEVARLRERLDRLTRRFEAHVDRASDTTTADVTTSDTAADDTATSDTTTGDTTTSDTTTDDTATDDTAADDTATDDTTTDDTTTDDTAAAVADRVAELVTVRETLTEVQRRQAALDERLDREADHTAEVLAYLLDRTDEHDDLLAALEDALESRFGDRLVTLDARTESLERELAAADDRLDSVESGLAGVDSVTTELNDAVESVQTDVSALEARQRDLRAYVDEENDYVASVLEHLLDRADETDERLAALAELEERVAALETTAESLTEQTEALAETVASRADDHERLTRLTRAAAAEGVRTATCAACGDDVDVTLLTTPACPGCDRRFEDLEPPARRFFGTATLTVAPTVERVTPDATGETTATTEAPATTETTEAPATAATTAGVTDGDGDDAPASDGATDDDPVWYDEAELESER